MMYELAFMVMVFIWFYCLINQVELPDWMDYVFILIIGMFLGVYAPLHL